MLFVFNTYSVIEKNDSNDVGLNEKNGTYGFDSIFRQSSISFICAVSTDIGLLDIIQLPVMRKLFHHHIIQVLANGIIIQKLAHD